MDKRIGVRMTDSDVVMSQTRLQLRGFMTCLIGTIQRNIRAQYECNWRSALSRLISANAPVGQEVFEESITKFMFLPPQFTRREYVGMIEIPAAEIQS